jgi:integrative and conjugative element protein (TIGR02256 family)
LEVGGVLAGYWKDDVAVVTDLIGPGPNATHGRSNFIPDHQFHESEIASLYMASGGTTVYLGDWHSHPLGFASLSTRDERTLRAIGSAPEARCSRPLMLLVAGSNDAWTIRVFTLGPARRFFPREVVPAELKTFY